MGLERNILVHEAAKIIQKPLEPLGYKLVEDPPRKSFEFWFEKEPSSAENLYRIIEFQPSGFGRTDLFELAINLMRRSYRDYDNPPKDFVRTGVLHMRLAPQLWEKGNTAMDNWWHFTSVNELRDCYADVLDKLIKYGIPYLEDINVSRANWWDNFADPRM